MRENCVKVCRHIGGRLINMKMAPREEQEDAFKH